MVKLIPSLLVVWALQVALASGACLSSSGPSPYMYDIDKQMTHRENMRNMVAGWRQYEDRLLFKGNFTVPRNNVNENKKVFQFPMNGMEGRATITHIVSIDMSGSTNGAVAYLMSGGIGYKRVSIGYNFKPNSGVNHRVEIYGL